MEKMYKPVIVVVAYNRPRSLTRILRSLQNARMDTDAHLIISIDNDHPRNLDVKSIAEKYQWPYGTKEVRYQQSHLGLRKHVLQCGDLANDFGSVVILEDDLFVSPYFFDYAMKALTYYSHDVKIGGISLYNQPIQEIIQYPFSSVYDGSDVYFIQFPSSLGQAWTQAQWQAFREWYDAQPDLTRTDIPGYIARWPESSWKKYFCAFLVEKEKYFAFPKFSFTTNFNDPGNNLKKKVNHEGQAPLRLFGEPYRFRGIIDSSSIYDVYLEMIPECVKKLSSHLEDYSFVMDLYGTRDLAKIKQPYLVTSRPSVRPLMGFKRALKPHEMNVILNLEGSDFSLTRVEDVVSQYNVHESAISSYKYYYTRNPLGWKTQAYYYYTRFRARLMKLK